MKSKILEIIRKKSPKTIKSSVNEETEISSSGIDSISYFNILVDLENEFSFEFEDERLLYKGFKNVKEIIEYVMKKIGG